MPPFQTNNSNSVSWTHNIVNSSSRRNSNVNSTINSIKDEIDLAFKEINRTSYYYLKKSIRKILRNTKKNIRYSKKKQTEVELILFYCNKLKNLSPPISKSIPLTRIFEREILRVEKIVTKLDADLQYDYGNEIEIIRNE